MSEKRTEPSQTEPKYSRKATVLVAQDESLRDATMVGALLGRPWRALTLPDGWSTEKPYPSADLVVIDMRSQTFDPAVLYEDLKSRSATSIVFVLAMPEDLSAVTSRLEPHGLPDRVILHPVTPNRLAVEIERRLATETDLYELEYPAPYPSFLEVLASIWHLEESGVLDVRASEVRTRVYFRDGKPVFAEQGTLGDTLGRVLLRRGRITLEQYVSAIEMMTQSLVDNEELRLGEVLVRLEILKPDQVYDALREQVREKILTCFRWDNCRYVFREGRDRLESVGVFETQNVGELILEGVQRHSEFERLAMTLGPFSHYYPFVREDFGSIVRSFGLTGSEARFVRQIKGEETLQSLQTSSELSVLASNQLLVTLLLSGVLEPRLKPATFQRKPTELPEPEPAAHLGGRSADFAAGAGGDDAEIQPEADLSKERRIPQLQAHTADGGRLRVVLSDGFMRVRTGEIEPAPVLLAPSALPKESDPTSPAIKALTAAEAGDKSTTDEPATSVVLARVVGPKLRAATPKGVEPVKDSKSEIQMSDKKRRLAAEKAFQSGKRFLRLNRFKEAAERFEQAVRLTPKFPEYKMYLEWTRFRGETNEDTILASRSLVRQLALAVLAQDSDVAKAHYILGHLLMLERETEAAERRFKLAIKHDPKDNEAVRELRLLTNRKGPTKRRG